MGNTLWNKLNNRNKSKKSAYEISKKTNIPEEKVKEIMNGERQAPTDRVDSLVNAIQDNNTTERSIGVAQAKQWISETDLKALRNSFNYSSQVELAKELNIDTSVICRLENKKLDHISDTFLIKYYDFFHDELNKKVKSKGKKKPIKVKVPKKDIDLSGITFEEAVEWYKDFDLKGYLNDKKLSYKDFAVLLGYAPSSTSMVSNLVNHTVDVTTTGRFIVIKAYAFVNGIARTNEDQKTGAVVALEKDKNQQPGHTVSLEGLNWTIEPQKAKDDITVGEDQNESLESKEVANTEELDSYMYQVENDSLNNYPYTISTAVYDGEKLKTTTNIIDEEKITIYKHIWDDKEKELEDQKQKIKELELQISRYEKLIDMIR